MAVHEWQSCAQAIKEAADLVREEVSVLREGTDSVGNVSKKSWTQDCLVYAGVLRHETISAALHRRRFVRDCAAHPLLSCAVLQDVFTVPDLASKTLACLDLQEGDPVQAASQAFADSGSRIPRRRIVHLYVAGGYNGRESLGSVERFDPKRAEWETLPAMPEPRRNLVLVALSGQLYTCGGLKTEGLGRQYLNSVERFDPLLGVWVTMPPMRSRRAEAVGAAMNGRLYVCGGFDGRSYLNSVESFNPQHDDFGWESVQPANEECARAVGAVLAGHFCVCGGFNGPEVLRSGEYLDENLRWHAMPEMLQARRGAGGAVIGGCLFVCGGFDGQDDLSSVECFNPEVERWHMLPNMLQCRGEAACAAVAGRLYICGGLQSGALQASMEFFDPMLANGTGEWQGSIPMLEQRAFFRGTALVQYVPTEMAEGGATF